MTNISRKTKETDIELSLELSGSGNSKISTGIGFFDHMLEALSKHAFLDLKLTCKGDINVDFHHSVEDVGIVIGQALHKEIFPVKNMERFGEAVILLDEAAVSCVIDLSGRSFFFCDLPLENKVGEFDAELTEEFFRALVTNASFSVHLTFIRGKNRHHIIEAAFKAFAVALRRAVGENKRVSIPSTKGVL
ncbi:MAG: imidazoleglycerol-phosphate dehydratase HisB [Campylobacteraceae bacterium]|jgi:imidazoleglycerol-phosphate dehydratase|nr:imidazoleglycerol-phosphate dehydratase HisB [Campylobacteraceae bacterium]